MNSKQQHIDYPIINFKGTIDPNEIVSLIESTELKLQYLGIKRAVEQKIISISIELLQNIYNYVTLHQSDDILTDEIEFVVSSKDDSIGIITTNKILQSDIKSLQQWIDMINGLSKEQLREFYKKSLDKTDLKRNNSASLGLIEIARRSGNTLKVEFEEVNKNLSFVRLIAKVAL